MNARPHPGLLPQERMNRSPFSGDKNASGVPSRFGASLSEAAVATVLENFPNAAPALPLSPGERAGVRASVAV